MKTNINYIICLLLVSQILGILLYFSEKNEMPPTTSQNAKYITTAPTARPNVCFVHVGKAGGALVWKRTRTFLVRMVGLEILQYRFVQGVIDRNWKTEINLNLHGTPRLEKCKDFTNISFCSSGKPRETLVTTNTRSYRRANGQ